MARLAFTLEQLRTFLAVARQQSMSRAAESLFLTQGAVSQQVANLEAALGLRLLERRGRRVWLTEAGKSIAVSVFEIWHECKMSVAGGILCPNPRERR